MRSSSTIFSITKRRATKTACMMLSLIASLAFVTGSQSALSMPYPDLKIPAGTPKDDPQAGLAFMKTQQYKDEFDKAIKDAKAICEKHVNEPLVCIVSDIDETLLDNSGFFREHEKFDWSEFTTFMHEAKAPTLKKTADLLSWARKNGFAIFLVTGRQEKDRSGTIQNLVRQQVAYDGLYMRPNGDKSPASEMKTKIRKSIQDMGFHIVVNIGDQYSDLAGGLAEDVEKLPNKMYFVP